MSHADYAYPTIYALELDRPYLVCQWALLCRPFYHLVGDLLRTMPSHRGSTITNDFMMRVG